MCCVLRQSCGTQTDKNSTYFVNDNFPQTFNTIGQCSITVDKMNQHICQIRLDFVVMDIQQPDPATHLCTADR